MPLRATSLLTPPPDRAPADRATDTHREEPVKSDPRAGVPGRSTHGRVERSEGGLARSEGGPTRSEASEPRRDSAPTRADAAPFARQASEPVDMQHVLRRLSAEVGEEQFERYFLGQTRLAMRDNAALHVTVTSSYLAQMLERRFGEALRRATGAASLKFDIDRSVFTPRGAGPQSAGTVADAGMGSSAHAVSKPARSHNFRASLEDFLVGSSNRVAYTAVRRMAEDDEPVAHVFLHGACGLGKTHLLQGACALFHQRTPRGLIRYVTGEQFTNEFIAAVRANKVDTFRKTYRGVDLLCIDDVHFLSNKDATQTELLHTFDAIGLAGARVILASDEHPREIAKISDKLTSRFLSGAVVKIDAPDPALRRQLITHVARKKGLVLDADAAELLAVRSSRAVGSLGGFGGSVREIEGLLNQVEAISRLLPGDEKRTAGTVSAGLVRRALGIDEPGSFSIAAGPGMPRRPIPVSHIVDHVCQALAVDAGEFAGKGRHKRVVFARSVAAVLARQLTTQSFPEIARAMGRGNHSTIITAQRRLQRDLESKPHQLIESDLAPLHPGLTLSELLTTIATTIRQSAR
jgi:chromosomal replication initiator protein